MTRTPSIVADLLADCNAQGIWLTLAVGDELDIDAPKDALTPDLLARLKAHKADLLAMLRPTPDLAPVNRSEAPAVWQATLGLLVGDPLFAPDLMRALRAADVRWGNEPAQAPAVATSAPPAKPTQPVCCCGSTTWQDVPIHGGKSVRRDCGRCGRFLDFPVWHGEITLRNEQQRVGCQHGSKQTETEAKQSAD